MIELDVDLSYYPPEARARVVAAIVEALAEIARVFLSSEQAPALERSGVVYREGGPWRDVPTLLACGEGDCRSLVAWRLAEIRETGGEASVRVLLESGPFRDRMHLQIVRADGTVEDPSVDAGMGLT